MKEWLLVENAEALLLLWVRIIMTEGEWPEKPIAT